MSVFQLLGLLLPLHHAEVQFGVSFFDQVFQYVFQYVFAMAPLGETNS